MATAQLSGSPPDAFVTRQDEKPVEPQRADLIAGLRDFLPAGGARTTPMLCFLGQCTLDGSGDRVPILHLAAALQPHCLPGQAS
ncbi:hypothetical protein [Streptomyces coerulescens]|uniref:Uncharacterized protein n=1 Tax=Streptomyces coerulescens TaxID=29304 RepID=A0ABW0CJD1_STRCD